MRSVYEMGVLLLFAALIIAWVVMIRTMEQKASDNTKWFRDTKATPRYWLLHFGSLLAVIAILCSTVFLPVESLFFQYDTFDAALDNTIGTADHTLQGETIGIAIRVDHNMVYKYSYVKSSGGKWYLCDKMYRKHTETELSDYHIYTFSAKGATETIVLVVEPANCKPPEICDQYQSCFADSDFIWVSDNQPNGTVSYAIIEATDAYYDVSIDGQQATIRIK